MCGNAKGNSIFINLWIFVTPDIEPASCKEAGTLLNPSIVYLVASDPSYVAKYTGEYLVYKNADGIFIAEFAPSSPMEHFICDNSNNCINANSIRS